MQKTAWEKLQDEGNTTGMLFNLLARAPGTVVDFTEMAGELTGQLEIAFDVLPGRRFRLTIERIEP